MTNITEFATLLFIAEQAIDTKTEDSLNIFLAAYEAYPKEQTLLEQALIEVMSDLTMHEYLCDEQHDHEHEEQHE